MTLTIGNIIAEKRKELNLSQRKLSKKTNIANSTISRIETDIITQPDPSTIRRLSAYLSLDYNYLLSLAGHIESDSDIRKIQRALSKMPAEKKQELMELLSTNYPEYFSEDE